MGNILLSIIIPTKNRHGYLKSFVETAAALNPSLCEVVIQDNSEDTDDFPAWIENQRLPHVHYINETESVPITINADRAISRSKGEYVCFIGDDDSVSSYIVSLAAHMKKTGLDSVICPTPSFYWPGVVHRAHKFPSFTIPHYGGLVEMLDPNTERNKCLRRGGCSLERLPMVYQGIVSRAAMDKVYDITNTYFPGPSPDMASAIALSYVVKKHAWVDAPFVISGQSPKSAGGLGARHAHIGSLKDKPFLPSNIESVWDSKIPMIWTAPTIWGQSARQAVLNMGRSGDMKFFNYSYLYAVLLHQAPSCWGVVRSMNISLLDYAAVGCYAARIAWKRGLRFAGNFLRTRSQLSRAQMTDKLETSRLASQYLDKNLREHEAILPFPLNFS